MNNWNNATPWRAGQRPANDYASGGDLSAVRGDYPARDYSLLGEVYAGTRYRIGPPPLGAFPGHLGMGRRAPAPSSVDTEKFVQSSQQKDRVNGTGWEDSPELIPAVQQQPAVGSTPAESGSVADVPAENRSCVNGTVSVNSSTNGSNDSEGGGSGEKGSAGGERGGGFSARHTSHRQGGERRPGAQSLGSATVGRGRGRGCDWREPGRKRPTSADAPKFIPAAKQQPAAGSTPAESGSVADMPAENRSCANGTVSVNSSTNGSNNSEGGGSGEKGSAGGERGGGISARHTSHRQGGVRRPGAQSLGSATVGRGRGRGCDWREPGRKRPTPAVRNREGVDGTYVPPVYSGGGEHPRHVGSGRALDGDRDRGRMVQESGGSGPVEREAENGGPEGRRDAASRRRKKLHRESGTRLWRGRDRAEEPRTAGGGDAAEAAGHSPVSNDRKAEEEDRSQKWDAADGSSSSPRNHSAQSRGEEGVLDQDRREQLSAQLLRGSLDCLVCWEPLRPHNPAWSCPACYHVLHLACARRWALSSLAGSTGWPCPACRHEEPRVPTEYRCWCGKRRDPVPDRSPSRVPHGCGEQCGKPRGAAATGCPHRCALRCHPGPCPPCDVQVNRWCGCGRERRLVACGQQAVCGAVCGLPLSCGRHCCERACHPEPCGKCQLLRSVVCWGGRMTRQVTCNSDEARANGFACNLVCGRVLVWGNFQAIVPCEDAYFNLMMIIIFAVFLCCSELFDRIYVV